MRVAVVSKDGSNVDEHFGKASRFLIYELESTGPTLVEERTVQPFSDDVAGHSFNSDITASSISSRGEPVKKKARVRPALSSR